MDVAIYHVWVNFSIAVSKKEVDDVILNYYYHYNC